MEPQAPKINIDLNKYKKKASEKSEPTFVPTTPEQQEATSRVQQPPPRKEQISPQEAFRRQQHSKKLQSHDDSHRSVNFSYLDMYEDEMNK